MRLVALASVLISTLAAPSIASACQCYDSAPLLIGPAPDSTVPPTPTLYVFFPNSLHDGTSLIHEIYVTNVATSRPNTESRTQQIAIDPEYIVYEVQSDASEGVIELHIPPNVYRYTIATTPIENRARPIELMLQEMTTCGISSEKAVTVTLQGNAAAYAFEWDDGRKTIVPVSDHWADSRHDVRIGGRCGATNVPFEQLHESHHVTLRALFSDGRSRVVATSTLQLAPTLVRSPVEFLDSRAVAADEISERPMRTFVVQATANPTGSAIAGGAATGGLIVVGGALLRTRRRRHQNRL
jgi:hypothetical protein